ncbi:MAG: fibronectin type III domain-containing protein [Candidatus Brennerbacteria bacterium]|nr:fibronectin type III domain-containing protein [Candidatus Brennerbacteria bacterium]
MKRVSSLFSALAILSLIFPASGFAATNWPKDFSGGYKPDQNVIELKWQNVEGYSQQTLRKVSGPGTEPRVLNPNLDRTAGDKSFLDTNGGQPFESGVYKYQLQTAKAGETQTGNLDVSIMSEDSNIVIVKTEKGGPAVAEEYYLKCGISTESKLTVNWNGNVTKPHTLTLFRDNKKIAPPPPLPTGSGSYEDGGDFEKGEEHIYFLAWTVGNVSTSTPNVSCKTLATSPDTPSKLYAWALSPSSLLVNWKDNAVKPHTFELQRIKLTPEKPVFPSTDVAGVVTVSDTEIKLSWKNFTNADANGARKQLKGPYYHAFERSTSSNPFADRKDNSQECKYVNTTLCDPSFTLRPFAFADDADWAKTKTSYEKIDDGLREGTDYYYRARGCSLIRADYTRAAPTAGQNDIPAEACGKYGDIGYVGTSTLPAAPSDMRFVTVDNNKLSIQWRDYSRREDGFAVTVAPAPGAGNCATGACEAPKNGAASNTQGYSFVSTFSVTGLQAGTEYAVSVRSFRDGPWGRTTSKAAATGNATTDPEVAVASPTGGTISGDCSSGRTCSFEYATPVTLTATPAAGYAFTRWTSGPCNNSTSATCAWTLTANADVSALFTPTSVVNETLRVKAFVNGVETSGNIDFSLLDSGRTTVVSGVTAVPFTKLADYPTGSDQRFTFSYVGGTPSPGTAFQKIEWDNSSGSQGRPSEGLTTTGTGFVGEQGGWLEYRVYFTQTGTLLEPAGKFTANLRETIETAVGGAREFAAATLGFAERAWGRVKTWLNAAFAAIEYPPVDGVTLEKEKLEVYFKQFQRGGSELNNSVLEDIGLEPDTAYLYRVRACYSANDCTPYAAEEGAGKTLPAGAVREGAAKVNVCLKNSFCGQKENYKIPAQNGRASEAQCVNNNQCRDVGTSRQFFEETPR